jgi:hypothetical protein
MSDFSERHVRTLCANRPSAILGNRKYVWFDEGSDAATVTAKNAALVAKGYPPVCRLLKPSRKGIDRAEFYRDEIVGLAETGYTPSVVCRLINKKFRTNFYHETIQRALMLRAKEEA